MLKIIAMSDSHLGFDHPVRPRTRRRRRGPDFFRNFERVLDHCIDTDADLLVHAGDLFFRSKVNQAIIDKTYRMLFEFAEAGIPVVIVPGNHERSFLPQSILLEHPHIHVFDQPRVIHLTLSGITLSIAGFPNIRNGVSNKFPQLIGKLAAVTRPAAYRLLCLHQVMSGARVGPVDYRFRKGPDVIDPRLIPAGFNAVICGHIHRHQILYSGSDGKLPLIFPGSIERTSFAEKDENKGFCQLEFRNRQFGCSFLPLPAREMIDMDLRNITDLSLIRKRISVLSSGIKADSIVRLRFNDPGVGRFINRDYLKSVFPPGIDLRFSYPGKGALNRQNRINS